MAPDHLNVYYRGTDNSIFELWWNSDGEKGHEGWGGKWVMGPVCTSRQPFDLSVFGVNICHEICHKNWRDGHWTPFINIGGRCRGLPAVSSRGNGILDIFHIGRDYELYHKFWDGHSYLPSIFDYTRVPSSQDIAKFIYDPCAVSWGDNHVSIFAVSVEGHLFWANWTMEHDWKPLEKIIDSHRWYGTPKAVSRGQGKVDVFCIGDNSTLYHLSFSSESGWSVQHTFPSTWASDPEAVSNGPDRIDVFILGYDRRMYHTYWNECKWSPWDNLGGVCMTAPRAVSQSPGRIDVFHSGEDGVIYRKKFNGEKGWTPSFVDWEKLGGVATSRLG
jgi:hypothetical protein